MKSLVPFPLVVATAAVSVACFAFAGTPGSRAMRTGLPDAKLTPGALNPAVTQATIGSTICKVGWTKTVRPPVSYTNPLKRKQIRQYGYRDTNMHHYEEDHLISLELGGSPTSPKNLWPEPHYTTPRGHGSYKKDGLETHLKHMVCDGKITLHQAQDWIAHHWVQTRKRIYGGH